MQESDEEEDGRDDNGYDGGGYNYNSYDFSGGVDAKAEVPLARPKQQETLSGDRDEWKQKYEALVASRQQVAVVEEEIVVNKVASVGKKQKVKTPDVQQPTPAKQPVAVQHTTPLTFMQIQAIQRSAVRLARSQEAELALNAMDTYYMMQGGS